MSGERCTGERCTQRTVSYRWAVYSAYSQLQVSGVLSVQSATGERCIQRTVSYRWAVYSAYSQLQVRGYSLYLRQTREKKKPEKSEKIGKKDFRQSIPKDVDIWVWRLGTVPLRKRPPITEPKAIPTEVLCYTYTDIFIVATLCYLRVRRSYKSSINLIFPQVWGQARRAPHPSWGGRWCGRLPAPRWRPLRRLLQTVDSALL